MGRRTVSLTGPPVRRSPGRFVIVGAIFFIITIAIVLTPRSISRTHITGTHNPGAHPYTKPQALHLDAPVPDQPHPGSPPPPAKLIVKVQLPGEDLNWLLKLLPDWRNQVVALDPSFARLHAGAQRVDRGRIAAAYLDWIITNYEHLSETIVFVGPEGGLETPAQGKETWRLPRKALVKSIQALQTGYVQDEGFAPLNCPNQEVCEDRVLPFRHPPDEFRTMEVSMAKAWTELFNNTRVPEMLGGPSGVEFAVSAAQIRKRSVDEYVRFWEWLATTKMDDDTAGKVMERLWHVVFGRESVWCPAEEECRCGVFGKC